MSLIAGITGQPVELFDGAKINSISEYTSGNGVQLQGRTNGVAIEAGKVGETTTIDVATPTIGSNQTNYALTSRSLPAGRWMIVVTMTLGAQGVAMAFSATVRLKINGVLPTNSGTGINGVDKINFGYAAVAPNVGYTGAAGSLVYIGSNLNAAATVTTEADFASPAWNGSAYPTFAVQYLRIT